MDSALAWIGQIAEWLGRFIPRREIVDVTEGGVKFVRGNEPKYCGPGIHWYWPWMSTWFAYPTARQADRLQTQTMTTEDGKVIIVGGMIVYAVEDLLQLATTTYLPEKAVKDISLTAIHDVVCNMTWDDLQQQQRKGTLDTKLKNAAQRQLSDYGVKVIKLMLIDLAPTRVLRLSQSTSQEEN